MRIKTWALLSAMPSAFGSALAFGMESCLSLVRQSTNPARDQQITMPLLMFNPPPPAPKLHSRKPTPLGIFGTLPAEVREYIWQSAIAVRSRPPPGWQSASNAHQARATLPCLSTRIRDEVYPLLYRKKSVTFHIPKRNHRRGYDAVEFTDPLGTRHIIDALNGSNTHRARLRDAMFGPRGVSTTPERMRHFPFRLMDEIVVDVEGTYRTDNRIYWIIETLRWYACNHNVQIRVAADFGIPDYHGPGEHWHLCREGEEVSELVILGHVAEIDGDFSGQVSLRVGRGADGPAVAPEALGIEVDDWRSLVKKARAQCGSAAWTHSMYSIENHPMLG